MSERPIRWDYDLLQSPFVPRPVPGDIPPTLIDEEPTRCAIINVQWLKHIYGVLEALNQPDAWNGTDEQIFSARQEIEKLIATLSEECALLPLELRVLDCQLQTRTSPADAWENVVGANFVKIDGSCPMTGGLEINPVLNETNLILNAALGVLTSNMVSMYGVDGVIRFNVDNTALPHSPTYYGTTYRREDGNALLEFADTANYGARFRRTLNPTRPVIMISGMAGQSGDLMRWNTLDDAASVARAGITAAGAMYVRNQMLLRGLPATGAAVDMGRLYTTFTNTGASTYVSKVVQTVQSWNGEQIVYQGEADPAGGPKWAFGGTAPVSRPTITGERDANPALAALLTGLASQGLIVNSTTAGTGAIASVEVETLDAGEDATANYNATTRVLSLGIPRGNTGLTGAAGADGASPEMRVSGGYIQWRQDDDDPTWANLVSIESLTGAPGECASDCLIPPQPTVPAGVDRDARACAIATGLGAWLHGAFDDSLDIIVAGVAAGKIVSGIVSDLIDAIPVLGAVVDAITNFAENTVAAVAEEIKAANGDYFREMIQCQLYCIMVNDTDDFTEAYLSAVKGELQAWGTALPPQTPLLVLIGQSFALWLNTVPDAELLRRANVYKDDTGNCELCPQCEDATVEFAIASSSTGEDVGTHTVSVRLNITGTITADVTVPVTVTGGTASTPADFTLITTSVTFPAGSGDGAIQEVDITIEDDLTDEPNETIILTLGTPSAGQAVLGAQTSHTVTIEGEIDDWCFNFDFTTGESDWEVGEFGGRTPLLAGEYVAATGYEGIVRTITGVGLQYANELLIVRSFTAVEISRVLVTYDSTLGEFEIPFDGYVRLLLGGSQVAALVIPGAGNTTGTDKTADLVTSPVEADQIEIYIITSHYNDGTDSGSSLIKAVRVEGIETSPFGDNC